ncbi:effector-associated constant component EACC1 (plasmid) [Nocardia sp. CA-084685]|uniref:effector-associated constant component EACC1 n=1 Tax=Nocardia sp. CA-084685 TaxID=3239970 RepID=UPI003D97FBCC
MDREIDFPHQPIQGTFQEATRMSEFQISVTGTDDDVDALHDLYAVVIDDDQLRTVRKSLVPGEPQAGHMGAEDVIRLVLDNTALIAALATCTKSWLQSRKSTLKLTVQGPAGKAEVVADGVNVATTTAVRRAFEIAQGTIGEAAR